MIIVTFIAHKHLTSVKCFILHTYGTDLMQRRIRECEWNVVTLFRVTIFNQLNKAFYTPLFYIMHK